jgi:hypothetical protein
MVMVIFLPQPQASAQSIPPECPTGLYQITFPQLQDRTLASVKTSELLVSQIGTAPFENTGKLLEPPQTIAVVTRDLSQFWRMRVRKEDVRNLEVEYLLKSTDGSFNVFKNAKAKTLGIKPTSCPEYANTAVVEGGIQFEFRDIFNTGSVGMNKGELTVCVKRQGNAACF